MVLLLYHISHSNICVLQRKKIPFPLVLFTVDNFFTRLGNMVKEPVYSHTDGKYLYLHCVQGHTHMALLLFYERHTHTYFPTSSGNSVYLPQAQSRWSCSYPQSRSASVSTGVYQQHKFPMNPKHLLNNTTPVLFAHKQNLPELSFSITTLTMSTMLFSC